MQFEDGPQLPLTTRRLALVIVGVSLFLLQLGAAALLAEPTTGKGDASIGVFAALWSGCVVVSTVTTLCIVRQADIPDVFTAALLVTITPFALYALLASFALRGTDQETDIVSSMFLGITVGGLTAVLVWGMAMGVARALKLPTTAGLDEEEQ